MFVDDIVLCEDKDVDMTEYLDSWRRGEITGRDRNGG